MKHLLILICGLFALASACKKDTKLEQTIEFGEIAPQNLKDGSLLLKAKASSGLPITFESTNSAIVIINGNTAVFQKAGSAGIVARQPGNDQYYEASYVVRDLTIHEWDPNKKNQTITFELVESRTNNDPPLQLVATSSSGLPVKFTSGDPKGQIDENNQLILYHGPYTYDVYIDITASQEGNSIYNPADNVVRTIHALGIGYH